MLTPRVSNQLWDDFRLLADHLEGQTIRQVITFTENSVALLLENNLVVVFSNLEDEIIVDLESL
ncbi:MAG TPA: hypothetical protein PLG09_04995 [Syntrophomonadaceae bacterium]|nr:hypothetical protein [Syntrophomonadaceae bacterium]HOQ09460.1 hypothetical protein [Syntrophomonadaceae bacterium]HPU48466.1 hypothetical protein [Syntrophomonadaceae bacterium]